MSWTETSTLRPDGQKKIRVKTKELGLSNLEEQQLSHVIRLSRDMIPQVIAWLSWPMGDTKTRLSPHLKRYFLIAGAWPDQTEINKILSVLELTMNGVNNKINVKVAPDDGAYGYVGFRGGVGGVLRGIFSPRHNLGTRRGVKVSRGDIHMDKDVLGDSDLAIITFIHEATHKYASTADHGKSGYLENDGLTFDEPGLTKAQALNNADSYAWFCFAAFYR